MEQSKLNEILALHKKWVNGEQGGVRANLRGANLRGADLVCAYLANAELSGANLSCANLSGANLSGADLSDTNLSGADLIRADLSDTNLRGADLIRANLIRADLSGADLSDTNLSGADLIRADLSGADLSGANLIRAKLSGAKLDNIRFNENTIGYALQCPSEGSFIAWKKLWQDKIAKLLIPEHAKRSSATTLKCRASEAVVLAIFDTDGTPCDSGVSMHDANFVYKVGATVKPTTQFDEDRWNECGSGIHFFISREVAERY